MERRIFLAVILGALVMYGWQALFMPPPTAPAPKTTAGAPTATTPAPASPSPATATPNAAAAGTPPVPSIAAVKSESSEREIVVETAAAEIVLTNRGARILHWRLKDYPDAAGRRVDLVPSNSPKDQPRPFALRVDDAQITGRLNDSLYQVSGDTNGRVDARASAATVVFEFEDAAGLRVRKAFRFEPRHLVSFSADIRNGENALNPTIEWGPGLGDLGAASSGGSYFTGNAVQPPQALYHRDGDVERLRADAVSSQPVHEGQFRFAGIDDHYFLAALVNPGQARLEFGSVLLPVAGLDAPIQFISGAYRLPQPPTDLKIFVGPKQFDLLRSVDTELVRAIDFGMFAWMVVPLLSALKWLYGFLGNYGWAIIVLTILLNLVLFYPRHRSVVAMRKMQAIQPEMKAIQERYANLKATDPAKQKMNTEIMNLYRERGVNPASGCVPMLLTMPVLLAFYSLLAMSIELRGAPFAGWIQDLSAPDPYFVIPLLMGVTMFWQQRITPTAADPTQQRVMMIMPVMFTAMMAFSPSGVVLYWTVSQLWAIGQQYLTNRLIGPPAVATARRGK
jgi:YidC/Oxa1 family membrane protein insertase